MANLTWLRGSEFGKNILCTLGFVFFLSLVASISAAPYKISSTTIEIPSPDEFVEVDQRMMSVWPYVQAAQGENRIIAFYIPKEDEWAALANIDVDIKRSMNVQTPSDLQGYTLSEDNFKYLIDNTKLLISEDKVGRTQDDCKRSINPTYK